MVEVAPGVHRVTFALPLGIDHVHCYLLSGADGWTIVDTALGLPRIVEEWRQIVDALDGPVRRIVVTHLHPDHVGATADLATLTGARVLQGRLDHEQCRRAWGPDRPVARWADHMRDNGMPEDLVAAVLEDSDRLRRSVHVAAEPELLDEGDRVDGWRVLHLPGHADGHLVLLRDDGVLVAGDTILAGITPTVGLWPDGRPDPLGDFVESLRRIVDLGPELALTGHQAAIDDPVARAREILAHHDDRLERTSSAVAEPRSAFEVSLELFPGPLPPPQRRFALAEALSHLERLVLEGGVSRSGHRYFRL